MINEKFFPQYVIKYWHSWAALEFSVAAQIVVADPDGRGSVTLWLALDFCLRLWRWTVHLHSFLNQSKGIFAPQGFLPWLYFYQAS
jgi:hypothetical protein